MRHQEHMTVVNRAYIDDHQVGAMVVYVLIILNRATGCHSLTFDPKVSMLVDLEQYLISITIVMVGLDYYHTNFSCK